MITALWTSAGVVLVAVFAMFRAPAGQADPVGTLLRTAGAGALLLFMGRWVGKAGRRRPPNPAAVRVMVLLFVIVAIGVTADRFSPKWSVALAVWYVTLFATGVLLNRWCEAPERYAVLVATFSVVVTSLVLMTLSAASLPAQSDLASNTALVAMWPNVTRIAGHPGDAAWTWLAWRVADRLRPPEPRRLRPTSRVAARPLRPSRPSARQKHSPR